MTCVTHLINNVVKGGCRNCELSVFFLLLRETSEDADSLGDASSQPDTVSIASRTSQNTADSDKVTHTHIQTHTQKWTQCFSRGVCRPTSWPHHWLPLAVRVCVFCGIYEGVSIAHSFLRLSLVFCSHHQVCLYLADVLLVVRNVKFWRMKIVKHQSFNCDLAAMPVVSVL